MQAINEPSIEVLIQAEAPNLCANAGVPVSEVVLISRKTPTFLHRWIYLYVGMFNGLIETLGEAIKYPLHTEKHGILEEVVLARRSCDSMNILYETNKYCLPLDLEGYKKPPSPTSWTSVPSRRLH